MKHIVPSVWFVMAASGVSAQTEPELRDTVDARLRGDRTGACLAAAVVDKGEVARTYRCADDASLSRIGPSSAFEIGSVTKTMTATLLAQRVERGEVSLDDPLARLLPEGTPVPSFQGAPILLRHVVTHSSGLPALPARYRPSHPDDFYVDLTDDVLLASLGDVRLSAAPGTQYAYSNFAFLLLSLGLTREAHGDYPALLARELFAPLGMTGAYVEDPPVGITPAQGHLPNGAATSAWHFPPNLAGIGGVRATLDDMVRYVRAELGQLETALAPALRRTQAVVPGPRPMGIGWMLLDVDGRTVHVHEGGTGGFSSLVAFDLTRQRGVVILSDTTWNSLGGLGSLGLPLIDPRFPLGRPRTVQTPTAELLAALAGDYRLESGLPISLRVANGKLVAQAAGQPAFELGYDSEGDFFTLAFDALLRPQREADGYGFILFQGGGAIPAKRVSASPASAPLRSRRTAPRAR